MSNESKSSSESHVEVEAAVPEFILADLELWFQRVLRERLRGHIVREHGDYGAVVNSYAAAEIPDWELRQKQDLVRDAINGVNALLTSVSAEPEVEQERIRSAEVRKAGVVYPCFAHTYHELMRLNLDAPEDVLKGEDSEQGFVTTRGRYIDRGEAFLIAQAAGQIIHKHGSDEPSLYSEDLRGGPEQEQKLGDEAKGTVVAEAVVPTYPDPKKVEAGRLGGLARQEKLRKERQCLACFDGHHDGCVRVVLGAGECGCWCAGEFLNIPLAEHLAAYEAEKGKAK